MELEVEETPLSNFDTESQQKNYVDALNFWEKEENEIVKEDFSKLSRTIRNEPSGFHRFLHSSCDASRRKRLEIEGDHDIIV